MSIENPYAPPKAPVAHSDTAESAPALWNPNAAANWSLLFTPAFGAILHMKNWQALGEAEKAASSKTWAIVSLGFVIANVGLAFVLPDSSKLDTLGNLAGFALLLSWYFAIGRSQNAYVVARHGKTYPRKGWTKPLLFAVGALLGLAFIVGFAAAIMTKPA